MQDLVFCQISILVTVMQTENHLRISYEIVEHELAQDKHNILEQERAFIGAIPSREEPMSDAWKVSRRYVVQGGG